MGSQIASLVLVFFAQRIILTTLTQEDNGTLFLQRRMTELFVGLIADFGMNGILLRRATQHPERRIEIIASALWLRIALWTASTLVVVGYVVASGGPVTDVLTWAFFLLIASRTTLLRYTLEVQERAASRFTLPSLVAVLDAVLFFVAIYAFRHHCTPSSVILIFFLTAIPGFILVSTIGRGQALRPSLARMQEMRTLLAESLPMLIFIVIWGFQDKIDAAIVEMFVDRAGVGVLGAAYTTLGPVVSLLPQTLALVALPEISRLMISNKEQAVSLTQALLRTTLLITTLIAGVTAVLLPLYMHFVSGSRYLDSELIFVLFAWTAPGLGILVFIQEILVAMGRQKDAIWIAVGMLICTVAGGFLVVPGFQVVGSVVVKLTATYVGATIALVILFRVTKGASGAGMWIRGLLVVALMAGAYVLTRAESMSLLTSVLVMVFVSVVGAMGLGMGKAYNWQQIRNVFLRSRRT